MTNYEEIVALSIFIPCSLCVIAGACSMASYKCSCCSSNENTRRPFSSSNCRSVSTRVPMRMLRLTQTGYRRLTGGSSTRDMELGRRIGNDDITEFDYRQNLHLERGVLSLEPPPSYTVAMSQVNGESEEYQSETNGEQESEDSSTNNTAVLNMKGSLPPYDPRHSTTRSSRNNSGLSLQEEQQETHSSKNVNVDSSSL